MIKKLNYIASVMALQRVHLLHMKTYDIHFLYFSIYSWDFYIYPACLNNVHSEEITYTAVDMKTGQVYLGETRGGKWPSPHGITPLESTSHHMDKGTLGKG